MSFCPKSFMSLCPPKYVFMSTDLYVFMSKIFYVFLSGKYVFMSQTFMSLCQNRLFMSQKSHLFIKILSFFLQNKSICLSLQSDFFSRLKHNESL